MLMLIERNRTKNSFEDDYQFSIFFLFRALRFAEINKHIYRQIFTKDRLSVNFLYIHK